MADHTLTITTNFNTKNTGSSGSNSGGSSPNYGIAGNMTQQLQTAFGNLAQIMRQLQTSFKVTNMQFSTMAHSQSSINQSILSLNNRIRELIAKLDQILTVNRSAYLDKNYNAEDKFKFAKALKASDKNYEAIAKEADKDYLNSYFDLVSSSHNFGTAIDVSSSAADKTSTSFKTLAVNMDKANAATKRMTQDPNSGLNHLIKWGIVSRFASLITQFGQAAIKARGGDERSMAIMGAFGTIGSYAAAGGAALGIPGAIAGSIVGLTKSLIDISDATRKVTENLRKFDEGLRAARLDTRVAAFSLETERLSLLANDEYALDPSTFAQRLRSKIGDGSLLKLIEQGEDKLLELQNLRNAYKTMQRNYMLRGL